MTTIPTALRLVRLSLAATLLGAGLLIVSAPPAAAGEVAPTSVATTSSQVQGADPASNEAAPSGESRDLFPLGMVGFGWG